MIDAEQVVNTIAETLFVDRSVVVDDLAYQSIPEWDSIAHMTLMGTLEEKYGITIDENDIVEMTTVAKIKTTLSRYRVSSNG